MWNRKILSQVTLQTRVKLVNMGITREEVSKKLVKDILLKDRPKGKI